MSIVINIEDLEPVSLEEKDGDVEASDSDESVISDDLTHSYDDDDFEAAKIFYGDEDWREWSDLDKYHDEEIYWEQRRLGRSKLQARAAQRNHKVESDEEEEYAAYEEHLKEENKPWNREESDAQKRAYAASVGMADYEEETSDADFQIPEVIHAGIQKRRELFRSCDALAPHRAPHRKAVARALKEVRIDKIVFLAPGSLFEGPETWMLEVAFILSVADQIVKTRGESTKVPVILQEPRLTPGDVRIVKALGWRVVWHPEARECIDRNTLVFAQYMDPGPIWSLLLSTQSGILIAIGIEKYALLHYRKDLDAYTSTDDFPEDLDIVRDTTIDFLQHRRMKPWPMVGIPELPIASKSLSETSPGIESPIWKWELTNTEDEKDSDDIDDTNELWGDPEMRIYWLVESGEGVIREMDDIVEEAERIRMADLKYRGLDEWPSDRAGDESSGSSFDSSQSYTREELRNKIDKKYARFPTMREVRPSMQKLTNRFKEKREAYEAEKARREKKRSNGQSKGSGAPKVDGVLVDPEDSSE